MPFARKCIKSTAPTNQKRDPSDLNYGTTLILKRQVPPFHYAVIRVDSLLSDTNGEEVQLHKFLFDCPIDKTKGIYDGRDDYIKCKRYEKKMKQRTDWRTRRMMGRV